MSPGETETAQQWQSHPVYGFAAAGQDSMLQDKTRDISPAELDKIQAAIRAGRSPG